MKWVDWLIEVHPVVERSKFVFKKWLGLEKQVSL